MTSTRQLSDDSEEWLLTKSRGTEEFDDFIDDQGPSDSDEGDKFSEGGTRSIQVLWNYLEVDGEDAAVVLVFPRLTLHGGVLDPDEAVEGPLEKVKKLFVQKTRIQKKDSSSLDFPEEEELDTGTVTMQQYQTVVRKHLGELLRQSGMTFSSFGSADGDETFMRISLPRRGKVIKRIAEAYGYPAQFRPDAYDVYKPGTGNWGRKSRGPSEGIDSDVRVPANDTGPSPAVVKYKEANDNLLMSFQHVDELRLIERRLSNWVNMEEMVSQRVISKHFPVLRTDEFQRLARNWANWRATMFIASFQDHCDVYRYFGARVAFVFLWFSFFTWMLIPLVIAAVISFVADFWYPHPYCQLGFAVVMIIWASIFHKRFRHQQERACQIWGSHEMQEFDDISHTLPSFKPDMEGTLDEDLWYGVTNATVVLFLVVYVAIVCYLESFDMTPHMYAVVQTVMIRSSSWLWSKITGFLVDRQNHRTLASKSHKITTLLSVVKIFTVVIPLARVGFFKRYISAQRDCKGSARETAEVMWDVPANEWPEGVPDFVDQNYVRFGWIKEAGENDTFCAYGCFPVDPWHSGVDGHHAPSNCESLMELIMVQFYVTHLAFIFLNIIIPLLRTMRHVQEEKRAAEEMGAGSRYTTLQYQAKCHDEAPYEFDSWGGSREDDLLEIVQSFALLTCFGQISPMITVAALVFNLIAYRLLAYRMLYITCRPFPRSNIGIGNWAEVLETVSTLAILCNIGLILELSPNFRKAGWQTKLWSFLFFEHTLVAVQMAIRHIVPNMPADVRRVSEYNAKFKAAQLKQSMLQVPREETYPQCSIVDMGLPFE